MNPELEGTKLVQDSGPAQQEHKLPDPVPADKHGWWWGTGRRKSAVARVRIRPAKNSGHGTVQIQVSAKKFKTVDEYFSEMRDRNDAVAPLRLTDTDGKLDVFVRTHGGGIMGQAQAIRLGLARALVAYDPNFEPALRDAGFLTRDARKVERKKYGQPGARRRFQFSKR
ncbi:MAG: 30S ribosomal protein S9 [Planctomycetota bacterium]|nr:MAG: 30S ribosomal protein S9 [Planctomycetota bacterium]